MSHRDNCLHSVNPSTKVHFWTIQNLCVLLSNRNVATLQLCLVHGGTSYQPRRTPMGLFVTSLTRPDCLIMYVTHHENCTRLFDASHKSAAMKPRMLFREP